MDFLHGNIKQIYFGYLAAAFGSTQITSVYSIVDMAMVGQYQGPMVQLLLLWPRRSGMSFTVLAC